MKDSYVMTKIGELPQTGEQILHSLPWISDAIIVGLAIFAIAKRKKDKKE